MGTKKFDGLEKRRYDELRNHVKTGDLLFTSGDYLISKAIQRASDSMLSHVAYIYWLEERLVVVESVEGAGVRMVPLSKYLYDYSNTGRPYHGRLFLARIDPLITDQQSETIIGATADMLANPFSLFQFVKIWVRWYFHLGKDFQDRELVCSEFINAAFKKAGIDFDGSAPDEYVFPETIGAHPKVTALFQIVP